MKQTISVKLAPSPEQMSSLLATMERFNAACDAIAEVAFRAHCISAFKLHKLVYYHIRERFGLSAQLTVRAIGKVVEACKRDKSTCPRFRPHGAVPYDERIMSWKGLDSVSLLTIDGRVTIPVRLGTYQKDRIQSRRGQADLVKCDDVYFLSVTVDVPEVPQRECDDFLGIDVGVINLATDSDGTIYTGAPVEKRRRIFEHRRRNLQRKGTKAAHRKLRKIKRAQSRFQRDTNHVISKRVVATAKDTGRGIALEDLTGIRDRTTVQRQQRARRANWSFGQLRSFVTYKARAIGVPVALVDPRKTSQTCPECGCIDKASRRSQASFVCTSCGYAALADAVAARNIRARAAVMRPMVSDSEQSEAPGTNSRREPRAHDPQSSVSQRSSNASSG